VIQVSLTRALRVVEYDWAVYRRVWRGSLTGNFLGPLLFLASIGAGLGSLVNRSRGLGMPYLDFLAPALLATACMQAGVGDSTYPVMGKIRWNRVYDAMLATPLGTADVVAGELGWNVLRQLSVAASFFLVTLLFGVPKGGAAVVAVAAGALTGLAFAMPIYAYTATRESDAAFAVLYRVVVGPIFLFSGTFFPIERLPGLLQPLAWALPLSHGVALTRDLMLGRPAALDAAHAAMLLAYVVGGVLAARITLQRRMSP
jgi:lipooligosaccharide transport system permease protein